MSGFRRLNLGGLAVVVALVAGQGCAAVTYQDAKAAFQAFGSAIGPKFSLVQDRAALFVPVTLLSTLQVSPTAIFSVPIGNGVTLNPGAKVVWTACDDCGLLFGAQLGLSVPSANGRFVLRPEVGMLKDPGVPGIMWAFGVGLSMRSR